MSRRGTPMTMQDAFDRYRRLYVPTFDDLDVVQRAQLMGAFTAGLQLGIGVAALQVAEARSQVEQWSTEIEAFWESKR